MNLRQEFDKIMEDYGYPTLVVRQDRKIRCSCWNEKTQEADRECPVCFGLGWNPIVEKHTSRAEVVTIPETLGRAAQPSSMGPIAVPSTQWFFFPEAQIKEKDLIVDVDWSESGKPVYNGAGIHEINNINRTLRFEKGERIFQIAYTKDTPVQKNIRGIRIVEVNGIINYELAMEEM